MELMKCIGMSGVLCTVVASMLWTIERLLFTYNTFQLSALRMACCTFFTLGFILDAGFLALIVFVLH